MRRGPLEAQAAPEVLEAHAVDAVATAAPRLHGYDVEADLARHYRFSDVVYLALVGELPSDAQSRAFEIGLTFAAPISVAEGPGHTLALAGFFGAEPSGLLAAASATIADYARAAIEASEALFRDATIAPDAPHLAASSPEERASIDRLHALLPAGVDVPALRAYPRRDLAILCVLRAAGLRTREQLATALTIAGIGPAIAEATPRKLNEILTKYPVHVPPIAYVPPAGASEER